MRKHSRGSPLLAGVGALAVSGMALAFATSGSSGSAPPPAALADGTVVIHTDGFALNLLLGLRPGMAVSFPLYADNASSDTVRVSEVQTAVARGKVGCSDTDVTVSDLDTHLVLLPPGTKDVELGTVTATYSRQGASAPGACKGATFNLDFSTPTAPTVVTP